jgi:NAD+ synthase
VKPGRNIPARKAAASAIRRALCIDAAATSAAIAARLQQIVAGDLRARGAVVAMSGGVDSSVCAALAVRALGPERVLGLVLPERDSVDRDQVLAEQWAVELGIEAITENISPILKAAGCYRWRDDAVRTVVPAFGEGWQCKVGYGGGAANGARLNVWYLTTRSPGGETQRVRLTPEAYRGIVAATNFKQRVRKMVEYYHADRLRYAVVGTPNRLEYDQGFFVKGGDGLADVKPIAHLYKTQVYELAKFLGVPAGVTDRAPTTGTYSLPQTQDEFYFTLPLEQMDCVMYGLNHGMPAQQVAEQIGLPVAEVERAYHEIERKRVATRYLQLPPLLVGDVPEIH